MELKGKKINFLGDSITEGVGTSGAAKVYHALLKEKVGLNVARNYGKSGTKIARLPKITDNPFDLDFNLRAPDMDKDADIVVVFGGTNDYGHAVIPLGSFDNEDIHTFYGGMHNLCKYLVTEYVGKTIVFMTPVHRMEEKKFDGCENSSDLICFVKAIREVCEHYSIPVLDLYKESGMHGNMRVWCDKYMPDGLHPNDLGHEIMAHKLQKFLENL